MAVKGPTFTTADLAVECHRINASLFSLAGHPSHVDFHKVMAAISHKTGPIRRGRLRRAGANTLALGETIQESLSRRAASLPSVNSMTFSQAIAFWGIPVGGRIALGIARFDKDLDPYCEEIPAARALLNMSRALQEKFKNHLKLMEKRTVDGSAT